MVVGISFIICSLLYMLMLCAVYFSKKRVDTLETKIYDRLIVLNIIGLTLELLCCVTVKNMDSIPILNTIVNRAYLLYFSSFIVLFTLYMYVICNNNDDSKNSKLNIKEKKIVVLLFIILASLVIILPLHYYNETNIVYSYGAATTVLMVASILFLIFDFIQVIKNIKNINKKKLIPLVVLLICFVFAVIIRSINPGIILITCSFAFVTFVMYFTIENPDIKLMNKMELAMNEAERASRAKSDFLSSMSHEIRTPLNAIVGLSEDNLNYVDKVPSEVKENSEDIMNASQTLLDIVGNILNINDLENENMDVVSEKYNLKDEISNMCDMTKMRIGDKNIVFSLSFSDDIPDSLLGDIDKIKEITNNLLTNAIKFTESGSIELNISCENNYKKNVSNIIIKCKDTGKGIKEEYKERLFTKFDRLDTKINSATEGTGLGLAITKNLVDMLGGNIEFESKEGEGSIFVVTIPQKIIVSNDKEEVLSEIDEKLGRKLLIVDDDKLNVKVASKILSDLGYKVYECYTGNECIKNVKNNEYDLLLLDVSMNDMNIDDLLDELRNKLEIKTPIIALVADTLIESKDKYQKDEFVDYISKPFDKDELREKIDKMFN